MESFRFILPGYNVRPVEMSGAIGVEQLKKLPRFIDVRRKNAEYFISRFNLNTFIIQKEISESSWFGFSLIIKPHSNIKRETVVQKLEENGIECRPIVAGNFVKNEVVKYFDYVVNGELKNADIIHENGFFVGNSHEDISSEIDLLFTVLSEFE